MKLKKVLAVVMSLCMVAGTVSYGAPVITQSITAQAADSATNGFSFNQTTGRLTLSGTVDGDALRKFNNTYRDNVWSVIVLEGTVLPEDCSKLFCEYPCYSIDLSNADTSNVKNMSRMFDNCCNLKSLNLSGFDTSNVTDMSYMFNECSKLYSLDVSGFDTSNVTDMGDMFSLCDQLTSLDVSRFNTSKVTDMSGMFNSCLGLSTLDVSGFDTSNVTDMCDMFWGCAKLTSLDISKFDTSKVTNMGGMFCACNKLTTLDVSGFDTSKVTDMSGMFASTNLSTLDVSGFDTSKVTDMMAMFSSRNLTELDLSSFDTSKVTKMDWMFSSGGNLRSLTLGENFKNVPEEAELYNDKGWVNSKDIATVVSGNGEYAVIENNGKNTYKRLPIVEETKLTYPTNNKEEYIKKYHQVRFTWDKVESADKYSIAVFLAGKWRVQKQDITGTVYTSPKNLTPGKSYKVAIAARVDGKWDTANAIKHSGTVTIR